jgi:predicted component of type VI protein secretion system
MIGLIAPLYVTKTGLLQATTIKESIDSFLALLLSTVCGETCIDKRFGFVFNNVRFEIFNEQQGVVYNSAPDDATNDASLYTKKISGNSRNLNTFAAELKAAVERYEQRLSDVNATMSYVRNERKIYVTITGIIAETKEKYTYETTLKIWN